MNNAQPIVVVHEAIESTVLCLNVCILLVLTINSLVTTNTSNIFNQTIYYFILNPIICLMGPYNFLFTIPRKRNGLVI